MGFIDTLAKLFKKESSDLKDVLSDAEQRANATLDRKEREMAMTPEEKLAAIQSEIDESDPMAEMRDKIEHKSAKAETVEEIAAEERARREAEAGDGDVIDAEVISDTDDKDTDDNDDDSEPDATNSDSGASDGADAAADEDSDSSDNSAGDGSA